jgi:DNA-binding winged helix-turn-helix (wHTH) protein
LRYLFEDCVLDTDLRELRRGAEAISIAPQVFDLLEYLIRNQTRVVSKDDLIAAVWNGRIVSDAALTTRLNVARSAIGDSGERQRLIKTLRGKGFRFVGAVQEETPRSAAPVEPPPPLPGRGSASCSSSPAIPASNTRASRSMSAWSGANWACAMHWKAACGAAVTGCESPRS